MTIGWVVAVIACAVAYFFWCGWQYENYSRRLWESEARDSWKRERSKSAIDRSEVYRWN